MGVPVEAVAKRYSFLIVAARLPKARVSVSVCVYHSGLGFTWDFYSAEFRLISR